MVYKSNFPPVGEPFEELSDEAKRIWNQIVSTNPHLIEGDRQELKRFCISSESYCMFTDLINDYHRKINETDDWKERKDLVLQVKNISSHIGMFDRALNALSINLALATTSRAKFVIHEEQEDEDPDEQYFS